MADCLRPDLCVSFRPLDDLAYNHGGVVYLPTSKSSKEKAYTQHHGASLGVPGSRAFANGRVEELPIDAVGLRVGLLHDALSCLQGAD